MPKQVSDDIHVPLSEAQVDLGDGPYEVEVVWEGGSGLDTRVSSWEHLHDDEQTLRIEYVDGETEDYEYGNIVRVEAE